MSIPFYDDKGKLRKRDFYVTNKGEKKWIDWSAELEAETYSKSKPLIYDNSAGIVLVDHVNEKTQKPWSRYKTTMQELSKVLEIIGKDKRADRIDNCANYLKFQICIQSEKHPKKLVYASFCGDRLCPMCAWLKSIDVQNELYRVCKRLNDADQMQFIIASFTVKNVSAKNLTFQINSLFKNWSNSFLKQKQIKKAVKGSFKSFEITYNQKEQTYHPHFHTILCVDKSYFTSRDYLSRDKFCQIWQKSMDLDYVPQVWISKVKDNTGQNDLKHAIIEACKYAVKPDAILDDAKKINIEVVEVLSDALFRRRLYSYSGIMKKVHKEILLEVTEEKEKEKKEEEKENEPIKCKVCGSEMVERQYGYDNICKCYKT